MNASGITVVRYTCMLRTLDDTPFPVRQYCIRNRMLDSRKTVFQLDLNLHFWAIAPLIRSYRTSVVDLFEIALTVPHSRLPLYPLSINRAFITRHLNRLLLEAGWYPPESRNLRSFRPAAVELRLSVHRNQDHGSHGQQSPCKNNASAAE